MKNSNLSCIQYNCASRRDKTYQQARFQYVEGKASINCLHPWMCSRELKNKKGFRPRKCGVGMNRGRRIHGLSQGSLDHLVDVLTKSLTPSLSSLLQSPIPDTLNRYIRKKSNFSPVFTEAPEANAGLAISILQRV